jgi:hypothetical protein
LPFGPSCKQTPPWSLVLLSILTLLISITITQDFLHIGG